MAMTAQEIMEWLEGLPEDAVVGVDDGGLCLRVAGDEGNYCEVGGLPEDIRYDGTESQDRESYSDDQDRESYTVPDHGE